MSIMSKILIVLLTVLCIALPVAVLIVHSDYLKVMDERQRYAALAEKADLTVQNLKTELAAVRSDRDNDVARMQAEIATLNDQLSKERNALRSANATITTKDGELANLKLDVTRLTGVANQQTQLFNDASAKLAALTTRAESLQKDYEEASKKLIEREAQLTFVMQEVKLREEQIHKLQRQIEDLARGEGIAPAAGPAQAASGIGVAPAIKGQITAVGDDLATVNVGNVDGVRAGMRFTVFRGATYLATLVINRVDESNSVGRLEMVNQAVQVNDSAWNRLD